MVIIGVGLRWRKRLLNVCIILDMNGVIVTGIVSRPIRAESIIWSIS